ncbi:MAG: hypothetical protein KJ579_11845, partial [Verrucomicrobia bacterium]|nr:hypothetical protein [Verrucomicrobiota bacterium]
NKVNALDRAAASGNAAAIREAALGVQGDPIAVQILNKQRPEDLRAVQRQTMDGIKQDMVRIARDNVAAASTRVPGAPVDSARVDIYMPENAPGKPAAVGADQIRAGHDIDATARLDGKDIPAAQSRQALSEAFFEAATGKKPTTPAERAEAVRFAEEHNMVATDRLHPEAYGRTPRDAAQILGPDKRTPVRDPAQLSGAIQYKSDAARNEAIRLREEAARVDLEAQALKDQGRMGEAIAKVKEADAIRLRADGKAFDQTYQGVKQLDRQVQPRVEAMGGQVPAHVQKGMDILRQVDSLEISPEQARQKLAAMGETVESITRKSAGLVEAAQVLKPPTQSNASLLNGGKSSFATPPEPNFEQKVGAAGEQIFQAMGGGALPPGASTLRQGINSAGGTIVKGAGALGVAHMAVTTGKDALEYKQLYDKLNDPNTTDAEANQIAARMDQIARGTAVGMSVGAAVASVPLVGQAAMVGGGAYVGTRYVIDNTKAGQAVDRAALGAIDAGMQGGEWAGEKLTGLAGGTTKLQLDQQQIAGLQSSYQQALARGDIRLKDGMTEAEVMAAIRRDGPHAAAGLVEPTPRGAIDAIDRLLQDPRVKPGGDESSLLRNLAVNMSSGTDAEREAAREKFAQYQQQKAQQQAGPPLPDLPPTYAPLTGADAQRAQQIKDRWDAAPDGSPEKALLGDMYQALAYGDAKQKEKARADLALPPAAAASESAGGMGAGADGDAAQAAAGGPGVQGSSTAANAVGDTGNVYGAAPSAGGMSFGDVADVVKQGIKQAKDKLVDSAVDNLAHDMDLNVQREEIQKQLGDPNLSADD